MLRTVSFLTLGLLALTACPGDDSGTTAGGSAGSTSAATTTENATDTNPMTTEVATGSGSADTTEGPGSTTDTPGSTTDTPGTTTEPGSTSMEPGTTTGTMGGVCDPDAADDDCAMCVKNLCCPELEACDADPSGGCQCFQECAQMNPGIPGAIQCGMDCMVNPLGAGTPTGELAGCTQANCAKCLG